MKNRRFLTVLSFVVLLLWLILGIGYLTEAKQMQPDPNRVKQIQAALLAHGFESGKTWPQTQEILRGIARGHGWQTHRAPDARVLILLDLGNPHSDPEVTKEGRNPLLDGPEK